MAGAGWVARRWQGQVPPGTLFWRDMVLVGGVVNLLTSFAALMLVARGTPTGWAVAVHFSPLPYNLFLFAALWRQPQRGPVLSALALVWLVLVCVL